MPPATPITATTQRPAHPQGLGWPQAEPEMPEATAPQTLGVHPHHAELDKGLVRPAGPAQMCD